VNTHRRYFTPASANATLPLVSRIVSDLLRLHPRWRQAVTEYELAQDGADASSETEEARRARIAAGQLAGEIEACLDELEQIGCLFRGFEEGLIDFPSQHEGRVVCLCWQHGESEVSHWHELEAGFPGRQPLDASFFAREGA
jgi:hypothetical protein